MLELELPYPPSVNHYWKKWRNRMVISPEGRAFQNDVCAVVACSGGSSGGGPRKPPAGGRIALGMDAYPPDRRRRDLDNLLKCTQDALAHAGVYEDDSQIDLLIARRQAVCSGGRMVVHIGVLPLSRCPLCGAPLVSRN